MFFQIAPIKNKIVAYLNVHTYFFSTVNFVDQNRTCYYMYDVTMSLRYALSLCFFFYFS